MKAIRLARDNGWRVWVTTVDDPLSVVVRFRRRGNPSFPRLWALWKGNAKGTYGFHRAYAQTAQRLGAGDLMEVLRDPTILTDVDPDNPFGNTTEG